MCAGAKGRDRSYEAVFRERVLDAIEACLSHRDKPIAARIDLDGVRDPEALEKPGMRFGLSMYLWFKRKKWL